LLLLLLLFIIVHYYSDKDSRKKLALEVPKPFISFCLFTASASSPQLIILKDVNNIDDEIKSYARQYLIDSIKFYQNRKSIELPGILKVYWADFGGNRSKVLKMISNVTGNVNSYYYYYYYYYYYIIIIILYYYYYK